MWTLTICITFVLKPVTINYDCHYYTIYLFCIAYRLLMTCSMRLLDEVTLGAALLSFTNHSIVNNFICNLTTKASLIHYAFRKWFKYIYFGLFTCWNTPLLREIVIICSWQTFLFCFAERRISDEKSMLHWQRNFSCNSLHCNSCRFAQCDIISSVFYSKLQAI